MKAVSARTTTGLNIGTLKYNYADEVRGEVLLDKYGDVYIVSSTRSSDFPVTSGSFQTTFSGVQDGCIIKLDSTLSNIYWSSFRWTIL